MVRYQNDDSNDDSTSFLSWTDTLHPESGVGFVIDPRRARFRSRNPLYAVYQEISAVDDDDGDGGGNLDGMPIVAIQVVAMDDQDDINTEIEMGRCHSSSSNQQQQQQQQQFRQRQRHQLGNDISRSAASQVTTTTMTRPQPWRHSNLIDLILGFFLSTAAFAGTLKIELAAFLVYMVAALFNFLADDVFGRHPTLTLFRGIFLIVTAALMLADSILLMVNVLVTELLGAIALLLCTLFGGSQSGIEWHMFIRRTCHLTRWGIRSCLTTGWKPDRIFLIPESVESSTLRPPPPPQTIPSSSSSSTVSGTEECLRDMETELSSDNTLSIDPNRNHNSVGNHHDVYTDNPNIPIRTSIHSVTTMTAAGTVAEELPTVTVAPENVHIIDESDILHLPVPPTSSIGSIHLPVPPTSSIGSSNEYTRKNESQGGVTD